MDSTLVELFEHNRWSNLRLLEVCAGLEQSQLEASAEGTYGRLQDTLLHLLAAEGRYVMLLTGQRWEQMISDREPFPGFAALREAAQWSGSVLLEVAREDPAGTVLRGERGGEPYAMQAVVPLVQAIHHAHEHRTQVLTILSQQGVEPPDLAGWAYGLEKGYDLTK